MFEPQKLFIGIIDFFAILLPGALLVFLVRGEVAVRFFGADYYYPDGPKGWIIFAFASYLLGHFIFLIGSWLLDDHLYDRLRKPTYQQQIRRLAEGKVLSPIELRWLSAVFFKKDADSAVRLAVKIKEHYLDQMEGSAAINAFQWCKARLSTEQPQALATVERFEADSKFFRSLAILCILVLTVLIPFGLIRSSRAVPWISVFVLLLALWRYMDQRLKATNQAYSYIIELEGKPEGTFRKSSFVWGAPSHAGGVVFRTRKGRIEYLLVRARKDPDEWVLPKGHIEPGEPMVETAVREVREETGVWSRIRKPLQREWYWLSGTLVDVQYYLMEAADTRLDEVAASLGYLRSRLLRRWVETERRECAWLGADLAIASLKYEESKDLLRLAERMRRLE